MAMSAFDIARKFPDGIASIPFDHAAKRVVSFCCDPHSGWRTYDRAGDAARAAGHFDTVEPWSLLWADALAGQLTVENLGEFSFERRALFARLISAVPVGKDLAAFNPSEREAVHELCTFRYPGVWAPKSTKVSSLYRPRAVPVLDSYVARAFGFKSTAFSEGDADRRNQIARVIDALASYLDEHRDQMSELRQTVRDPVRDIDVASDLRLLDIVIWCSRDDELERSNKKRNKWLEAPDCSYEPDPVTSIAVTFEDAHDE